MARKRWDEVLDRIPTDRATRVAEIGVWKGSLSRKLLEARPRMHLTLIDPWQAGEPGTSWWNSSSRMPRLPQSDYDYSFQRVQNITKRHRKRVTIHRATSEEVAPEIPDASLDLVFIDADHSKAGVLADIALWRPKVKPGGILSGHDYGAERFPGVAEAVHEVFEKDEVGVGEDDTWFVRLP